MDLITLALAKTYTDKEIQKAEFGEIQLDTEIGKSGYAADSAAIKRYVDETVEDKVDNIDFPVTSVNGQTGDIVIDIPKGFSGSWNDLTDKPFEETSEKITVVESITKVFNTKRYGAVEDYYICDPFETSDIDFSTVKTATVFFDEVEYECTVTDAEGVWYIGNSDMLSDITDGRSWEINHVGNNEPFAIIISEDITIYVPLSSYGAHTVGLVINQTSLKTIEDKFISKNIARMEDIPEIPEFPNAVLSVNNIAPDKNGNIEVLADWETMKNKPFGTALKYIEDPYCTLQRVRDEDGMGYLKVTDIPGEKLLPPEDYYDEDDEKNTPGYFVTVGAASGSKTYRCGTRSVQYEDAPDVIEAYNENNKKIFSIRFWSEWHETYYDPDADASDGYYELTGEYTVYYDGDEPYFYIARIFYGTPNGYQDTIPTDYFPEDIVFQSEIPVTSVNGMTGEVSIPVFSGSYNDLTDIPSPIKYIQADEPIDAPDGTLWLDTDENSDSIINIPNIELNEECASNEKFMGKQIYQVYFQLTDFPTAGQTKYIESELFDNIDTVLELTGTFNKNGLVVGSFSYGGSTFSLGYDYQQHNGATKKIFLDNKGTSTYFDANTTAIIKLKYTKME